MSEYFYPTFGEFIVLAVLVVLLCAAGGLFLAWRRDRTGNPAPLGLTIMVGIGVGAIYISASWYLVEHTFWPQRRTTLLLYSMAFWIIPLAFYTRLIMNALATTTIDKLSWLDVHTGDVSEFSMARELAARGDIDGALRVYRNYTKNKLGAFREAANLLRSNGRPQDALGVYQEIIERFADNRPAVAEALLRQAAIHEKELGHFDEAFALYKRVYVMTPESEYGKLAAQALHRSLQGGDVLLSVLDSAYVDTQAEQVSATASAAPPTAVSPAATD